MEYIRQYVNQVVANERFTSAPSGAILDFCRSIATNKSIEPAREDIQNRVKSILDQVESEKDLLLFLAAAAEIDYVVSKLYEMETKFIQSQEPKESEPQEPPAEETKNKEEPIEPTEEEPTEEETKKSEEVIESASEEPAPRAPPQFQGGTDVARKLWRIHLSPLKDKRCLECIYAGVNSDPCDVCKDRIKSVPGLDEIMNELRIFPTFTRKAELENSTEVKVTISCNLVAEKWVEIEYTLDQRIGSDLQMQVYVDGKAVSQIDCNTVYGRLIEFYGNVACFLQHYIICTSSRDSRLFIEAPALSAEDTPKVEEAAPDVQPEKPKEEEELEVGAPVSNVAGLDGIRDWKTSPVLFSDTSAPGAPIEDWKTSSSVLRFIRPEIANHANTFIRANPCESMLTFWMARFCATGELARYELVDCGVDICTIIEELKKLSMSDFVRYADLYDSSIEMWNKQKTEHRRLVGELRKLAEAENKKEVDNGEPSFEEADDYFDIGEPNM